MRELTLGDLQIISGGTQDVDAAFIAYSHALVAASLTIATMFTTYCGYHVAIHTGLMTGPAGAIIGAAFGLSFMTGIIH